MHLYVIDSKNVDDHAITKSVVAGVVVFCCIFLNVLSFDLLLFVFSFVQRNLMSLLLVCRKLLTSTIKSNENMDRSKTNFNFHAVNFR